MEKIVKLNGILYYGNKICSDADDAYKRFRDEYHAELGKAVYKRLGRYGRRRERVHGFGFIFKQQPVWHRDDSRMVPTRLLGLVAGSYCRIFGCWDIPGGMDDEQFERWFDWAFSKGARAVRLVGRKQKVGRTSKRLNVRYR